MVPEYLLKAGPSLKPEDIADGVLYVLGAPPNVQVRDIRFYSDIFRVM
jgi:NADP-dependent 3-hydroxy acid dehydrogenase YdfG